MAKKVQLEEKKQKEDSDVQNDSMVPLSVKIRQTVLCLFWLAVLGGGAYWVYQNPQIFAKRAEVKTEAENAIALQINQLQNQVATLQAQILNLPEPDVSAFENKVESLEKQTLNVIDSKADAGIVLGMLTRLDKVENRLDKMIKISDDGALILSAAMLVKQAAAEGGEFIYEAEILNQLTPATASIKKDVETIVNFAAQGVVSQKELAEQVNQYYLQAVQSEQNQGENWKERLNQKVSEYIKIRKSGEEKPQAEINRNWKKLAELVNDGQIKKAVKLIESSESDDIKQNQDLQNWLASAKNHISFEKAVRNIAAYSLAEMKVNNLKNKD
ncbi:MAG: hypothetical protein IJ660_02060 [Alphaproteobacteria bacterium]|nr:hypothetical protein [Alphaproteobacteria bacterium]